MSELLKINVNDHTEKKNGLTYLSWAWAWAEVLKVDPLATWDIHMFGPQDNPVPYMRIGKSAMVLTSVTVKGIKRHCQLPVMDHRNKAIQDPDAFAVNTAIMRCMTKAISMHGLGLYIYAGEDLPEAAAPEPDPEAEKRDARAAELNELALYLIDCHENGKDMDAIRVWYESKTWSADNPTATEEQQVVWKLLREHSKLRSTIKANSPNAATLQSQPRQKEAA